MRLPLVLPILLALAGFAKAQQMAITFDDLPARGICKQADLKSKGGRWAALTFYALSPSIMRGRAR